MDRSRKSGNKKPVISGNIGVNRGKPIMTKKGPRWPNKS